MIITGPLPRITVSPGGGGGGRALNVGEILAARVAEVKEGQGVLQLADGSRVSFAGARGLTPGEMVRLEVTALTPQVTMRLAGSESAVAGKMAQGLEQSLFRGPEILSRLLSLGDPDASSSPATSAAEPETLPARPEAATTSSARPGGGSSPTPLPQPGRFPLANPYVSMTAATAALAGKGAALAPALTPALAASVVAPETAPSSAPAAPAASSSGPLLPKVGQEPLLAFLEKNLPHLSVKDLLSGDGRAVLNLLTRGDEPREMVRRFREAAAGLTLETRDGTPAREEGAQPLSEGREALRRLGDLASLQELLPRVQWPDGSAIAGYRLFWLSESGLGEMVWRREGGRQGEKGEETVETILVNLTLTHLGNLQVRVVRAEGTLSIGIAAEEEGALSLVRGEIGSLRDRLVSAGLPLAHLDLFRLTGSAMREKRREVLGLGGGFAREI